MEATTPATRIVRKIGSLFKPLSTLYFKNFVIAIEAPYFTATGLHEEAVGSLFKGWRAVPEAQT
jgi:hypothetical protein